MREKGYYSVRTGRRSGEIKLNLEQSKRLFLSLYKKLDMGGFFQEAFGYFCVDADEVPGTYGGESDIAEVMLLRIRKDNLWPIQKFIDSYGEEDLFDVIEFLHDAVSEPVSGYHHSFSNCGMHYSSFDGEAGKLKFRQEVNAFLKDYAVGYELSQNGEILGLPEDGMGSLINAPIPFCEPNKVEDKVKVAIDRFRSRHSSVDDRKHALRDLADVLEYLRPQVKSVLPSQDEADLFNLANNFSIRHHNQKQKSEYDGSIWYSWMFYYYLATIHTCLRLLEAGK